MTLLYALHVPDSRKLVLTSISLRKVDSESHKISSVRMENSGRIV